MAERTHEEAVVAEQASGQGSGKAVSALSLAEAMNVAVGLHKEGMLDAAEELYGRVLEAVPEYPDALHFLGLSRHQRGHVGEALALLRRALAQQPGHVHARNNLGNMLLQTEQLEEARAAYEQVLATSPDYPGVHANLGVLLRRKGELGAAEIAFRRAIELDPQQGAAYHNLGSILRSTERDEEALVAFQKALALMPYDGESYRRVGAVLYALGRVEECTAIYQRWLTLEPDSALARHMIAACSGDAIPERASDAYVQQTFDAFADSFDKVLERLKYRAPSLVADAVEATLGPGAETLDVLDAGAGTGLCGPLLRGHARRLVGIDLSAKMLAKADERGVYDALETVELTAYLAAHPAAFDLIVSADTLVYFGNLDELFQVAAGALRAGGHLVFTIERADVAQKDGHLLNPHGRYSHNEDYVRRVLADAGFEALSVAPVHLRLENKVPVDGLVVTARLPSR
ncbi:MAG TPA: tetratricopeptide repeat protein [Polyangia bacterium]